MPSVQVTRIGTQVVVRLAGEIGDAAAADLERAYAEVQTLATSLVAVDLEEALVIEGAGLDFLGLLHASWRLRLLNAPTGVRAWLARTG